MSETTPAKILLVEDNSDLREVTMYLLESFGYTVVAVADGQAALAAFNDRRPDLVMADITMPGIDGISLAGLIRKHPSGADMPIVLMSGRSSQAEMQQGLASGADEYVIKPADPEKLQQMLAGLIGRPHHSGLISTSAASTPPTSAPQLPTAPHDSESLASANILFVDDDLNIRETASDLLSLTGANVLAVGCGREASQVLATTRIDLIISDLIMPNGDGRWLLHHVRSSPNLRHIKFIILSALTLAKDIDPTMLEGADTYITKPFDPDTLLKTVSDFLRSPSRETARELPTSDAI